MTLGEKLKQARKQAGLSQEQLAEKLSVSRSAVAKWETDAGIPDIDNLKILSQLLDVSIDYLVDDGEDLQKVTIKEAIDLSKFSGNKFEKKCKAVREKYPDGSIHSLVAKKSLTKGEKVFSELLGWLTPAPFGTAELYRELQNADEQYFLVEQNDKQFLVLVTEEFITSRELASKSQGKKFVIGDTKFVKTNYEVKSKKSLAKG